MYRSVVLVPVFVFAACILDEHYTGLGDKALPGDPLRPIYPDISCTCGGGGTVVDLSSMAWRLDSLALSKPISLLNDTFFTPQIEDGALNIVFVVTKDDRENGLLELLAGAADNIAGKYKLRGEGNKVTCTLEGASFSTVEPSELFIPVELLTPPELPLREVRLSGTFSQDGSAIMSGKLEAVLKGSDAEAVKLGEQSLSDMLKGPLANVPPDLDLEPEGSLDGIKESWTVSGTFTAKKVLMEQ